MNNDFLAALCNSLKIDLVYTNDDSIILTSCTLDCKPTIVVNRLFYKCPEKVANTIIEYCTERENAKNNYKIIEMFAKANLFSLEYIIDPPDETFRSLINKALSSSKKSELKEIDYEKDVISKGDSGLIEMDISSMTYTDFYGTTSKIKNDDFIKSSSESVIDIDIVVGDKMRVQQ